MSTILGWLLGNGTERTLDKTNAMPSPQQIEEQRDRNGCKVCADKGERTADNKKTSKTSVPQHSLRPQDQWQLQLKPTIPPEPKPSPNQPLGLLTSSTTIISPSQSQFDPIPTVNNNDNDDNSTNNNNIHGIPEANSTHNCECLAYQNSLCPLNRRELGRASWAFLHTLAATYPEQPTQAQQDKMANFVFTYAELYPCGYCADYTKYEMMRRPPKVGNRKEFQLWMCGVHNEVNYRIMKPLFDCSKVDERWGKGPADGSCGEAEL